MRPSQLDSAAKGLPVGQIQRRSAPGGHAWLPVYPTQKNQPALSLQPLHFMGVGDFGTES